jgi:hypothetical protein
VRNANASNLKKKKARQKDVCRERFVEKWCLREKKNSAKREAYHAVL